MSGIEWRTTSRRLVLMFAVVRCAQFAQAQTPTPVTDAATSSAKNASELIGKLDQLVEQNHQLEKQNKDLMEQIHALREFPAKQSAPGAQTVPTGAEPVVSALEPSVGPKAPSSTHPGPTGTAQQPSAQSSAQASAQSQSNDQDDKTLLPEASSGNAAIFGEFNPGRGFTVGRSEYGELNLSGYVAVRYLNQLPGDQTGIDHLGRPVPVDPRQDFQFHRVMLFSHLPNSKSCRLKLHRLQITITAFQPRQRMKPHKEAQDEHSQDSSLRGYPECLAHICARENRRAGDAQWRPLNL